ncbi:MAG: hypothetical protein ACM3XS_10085 [Bacteroidota bacterium]
MSAQAAAAWGGGSGVWQGGLAGAFLYGLLLVALDLVFGRWRLWLLQRAGRARLGRLLGLTFLARLFLILTGVAAAAGLFDRPGLFLVCLLYLASVPASLIAAGYRAGGRGG